MGQNESKAAGKHGGGRTCTSANSKPASSKRKALVRTLTLNRRKGKHVRPHLDFDRDPKRGRSADLPCAGTGANSSPALLGASVRTQYLESSNPAPQNYGQCPENHFSEIPGRPLGVSESAARHPHSSKHSSKATPLDLPLSSPRRSSSAAAPAAPPCGTSSKKRSKKKLKATSRVKSRPQTQRKCAEAHKSTLSRKNKFGFGRQRVDKSSATTEETQQQPPSATTTPLVVAVRSPPPPLPPKPQRVQRVRTEPPPQHHRRQPLPTPHAYRDPSQQQYLPQPPTASAASQQQLRSYSYFPQNSQNPHALPSSSQHTHYPSQGHKHYPSYYPPQAGGVTHTQVPAHHAHLYEQTPNSKVVHHKLTAVEEQRLGFPTGTATATSSSGIHPGAATATSSSGVHTAVGAATATSSSSGVLTATGTLHHHRDHHHRRPSTAHGCRTRAPAVVLPHHTHTHLQAHTHAHSQAHGLPSLVYTQSGAYPPAQHQHQHQAASRRLSEATLNTSNASSSTGYSCAKRPSFFAPSYPGDVHKLSAPHPHPHTHPHPQAYPPQSHSHRSSSAALTQSDISGGVVYPHNHSHTGGQPTAYSGLTHDAGGAGSQAQVMGNLMGTSCSARTRAASRGAHDPTEEDYFREWIIGPAIGSGGYSEVFRVHNRRDATLIKAAKRVEFQREADYEEFMHEAAIIKELGTHKHVLAIQGLIKGPRHGWMIFELMEGDAYDMFTKNEANRVLGLRKERMVANAVRQLLKGLIYCHEVGIVHFDIKPQNLLYKRTQSTRADGTVDHGAAGQPTYEWKLCDFNLARHRHNHPDGFYSQVYTLGYRAPEVIIAEHTKGRERYAEKAERYGVGATTFQMLTEFCAFESFLSPQTEDTDKDFIRCVLMKNLIECLDSHELLSLEARDFILRMMMFRPADRLSLEEALEHPFISRAHEIPQKSSHVSSSPHASSSSSSSNNLRAHTSTQSPQENRNNMNTVPHPQASGTHPAARPNATPTPGRAPPSAPVGDSHRRRKASAAASTAAAAAAAPEVNLKQMYHKSKLRYLKEYHTRKLNL